MDSKADTLKHIGQVKYYLGEVIDDLDTRGKIHDRSKLEEPEKGIFDRFTPRLSATKYGSPEYNDALAAMGLALEHHYAHNDHHPEHEADGIYGMNLLQLLEMLADWKAATMRTAEGDLKESIEINAERFGYDNEFKNLLLRTAGYLGWLV